LGKIRKKISIGLRFGNLIVVSKDKVVKYKSGGSKQFWKCECKCGNTTVIDTSGLNSGRSKSCGCLRNKGGKITNKGYRAVYCREDKKYVQQHRYVYEQRYGIKLLPEQNVHHINGDRADNRIENLELWDTSQPKGQRVEDKIKFYFELVQRYKDHPEYKHLFS
jgi:hypothetical protein